MRLSGHRLVFVGGLHRSGTTVLARCLAAHPQASGLTATGVPEDEGQHLQGVYPPAAAFGGPGTFAFDPRAHRTEETEPSRPAASAAAELAARWEPHWDLDRPVLVEKSPPNLLMTRYLQHLFPDAAFVLVVRHPVVVSLATARWRPALGLPALFAHWLHAHEIAAADAEHVRRLHVVRYEDLVARPHATLAALGAFLGLDGEIPADLVRPDRGRRYERAWAGHASAFRPGRRRLRREVEERFGARCARFGYRLDDLAGVRDGCELLPGARPLGVTPRR